MTLGERIKDLRQTKVLGQAELAREAGVSINTLWRIEMGQVVPRPATIRRIAVALGVEPSELVSGTAPASSGGVVTNR